MFVLTPAQALLIGFIVAPSLFALSAYFTRAARKRVIAALFAAVAFGLANLVWDQVAFRMGWWSYPAFQKNDWWMLLYLPAGLVSGGAFGLVGASLVAMGRVDLSPLFCSGPFGVSSMISVAGPPFNPATLWYLSGVSFL